MKPVLQVMPNYNKNTEFSWRILAVKPFDKEGESEILAQGTAWTPEKAMSDASAAYLTILKTWRK